MSVAFLGDTQETLLVERLIGREDNRATRARLIEAVARARPALVVHLGDLVALSMRRAWARFDEAMKPLAAIRRVAIRGNHDTWGMRGVVEREWRARFPSQERVVRVGANAIVLLDSNRAFLGEQAWSEQREWLPRTLATLDDDGSCARVVVCVHHPPRTNSMVSDDDVEVARDVLPAFIGARKTRALVSGHVHSYERFEADGPHGMKHFVVAGAGGGPRGPLRTGAKAKHVDACTLPSPRPLHYLWLSDDGMLEARDVEGNVFDRVAL